MLSVSGFNENTSAQLSSIDANKFIPRLLFDKNAVLSGTALEKRMLTLEGSVATNSKSWPGLSSQYDFTSSTCFVSGRENTPDDP
jgi:hypothetical protein